MISGANYKSVEIFIKTYNIARNMNENKNFDQRHCKANRNKYICSICLNHNHREDEYNECSKRKSESCPICQKNSDSENKIVKVDDNYEKEGKYVKNIQTSQPDLTQGVSLLNEVLTVFQTKKYSDTKNDKSKTIIFKDVSTNTENFKLYITKLTNSKIFSCVIEGNEQLQESKFVIVCSQPETRRISPCSIDLTHRKSSSIPQMKLEELKNSLKDKTKSKDAIEEVNRMFATVRKCEMKENVQATNRPIIRSGPRVLPVVKTTPDGVDIKNKSEKFCRYCQTNYKMSSGDTLQCCDVKNDRCEDCFYMMCCHYKHHINSGAAFPTCKDCEHKFKRS